MNKQRKADIEFHARKLQEDYWDAIVSDPSAKPNSSSTMDPGKLIRFLQIDYQEQRDLRDGIAEKSNSGLGGLIDRQANKIVVSLDFPLEVRRFTAAHELGHWVLHTDEVMHRDIPLTGLRKNETYLDLKEQEANYFASCILMPRGFIQDAFSLRFLSPKLYFDLNAGYQLGVKNPESLYRPDKRLVRELVLAKAEHYNGNRFDSLCTAFGVSGATMAIRLEDMELILPQFFYR